MRAGLFVLTTVGAVAATTAASMREFFVYIPLDDGVVFTTVATVAAFAAIFFLAVEAFVQFLAVEAGRFLRNRGGRSKNACC